MALYDQVRCAGVGYISEWVQQGKRKYGCYSLRFTDTFSNPFVRDSAKSHLLLDVIRAVRRMRVVVAIILIHKCGSIKAWALGKFFFSVSKQRYDNVAEVCIEENEPRDEPKLTASEACVLYTCFPCSM